jgi:hypothetical protein
MPRRHPGPLGARVENALQRHVEAAAAAGLLLTDVKPPNVLVRAPPAGPGGNSGEEVGVALVDFDPPHAMLAPSLAADCRALAMLTLLAARLACDLGRRAFARRIAELRASSAHCAGLLDTLPPQRARRPRPHGDDSFTLPAESEAGAWRWVRYAAERTCVRRARVPAGAEGAGVLSLLRHIDKRLKDF